MFKDSMRAFAVPILGWAVVLFAGALGSLSHLGPPGDLHAFVHTVLELISIFIFVGTFAVTWFSPDPGSDLQAAAASLLLLSAGLLDLAHLLTYPGMPELFFEHTFSRSALFSIAEKFIVLVAILVYANPIKGRLSPEGKKRLLLLVLSITLIFILLVFFVPAGTFAGLEGQWNVRTSWIQGILLLLCAWALKLLIKQRRDTYEPQYLQLTRGLMLLTAGQVAILGSYITLGHLLQAVADLYFFKALFIVVVKKPHIELSQLRKNLQHYEKLSSLGEIAAGTVHEVRNPLTAVRGFLQIIGKKCEEKYFLDAKEINTYVKIMLVEIDRTNDLLGEFLAFAKPQRSDFIRCDLNCIIRDVLPIMKNHGLLKGVEVRCYLPGGSLFVDANPHQIKQVLLNLSKNAFEAMEDSSARQLSINCFPDPTQSTVRLMIKDTGHGIPLEIQKNIFEPFFTTKDEKRGTGLGLSVVNDIIKAHNGVISLVSRPSAGTSFIIDLPLTSQEQSIGRNPEKELLSS